MVNKDDPERNADGTSASPPMTSEPEPAAPSPEPAEAEPPKPAPKKRTRKPKPAEVEPTEAEPTKTEPAPAESEPEVEPTKTEPAPAEAEPQPPKPAPKKRTRKPKKQAEPVAPAVDGATAPDAQTQREDATPSDSAVTPVAEDAGPPKASADADEGDADGGEVEKPVTKKRTRRPKVPKRAPFEIAGNSVTAGKRMRMELPIGNLMSGTPVALPLIVVHGKTDGPVVWLSAAIHGDEICGVEIIRQVLATISARTMSGTVIAAPVVNVHGFNTNDRYLPDRRDLNRSFPGSRRGSLASRIAHLFMNEVVSRSDVGIDLHTGADLRTNLPQIRCDIDHGPTLELATTFGAPIVIDARLRDGSLRQAAVEADKIMLLFEGGEASRFDPVAIAAGTAGVLRILNHLGLTDIETEARQEPLFSRSTSWSRASNSGIVHLDAILGEVVSPKQQLATIYDPFGKVLGKIKSRYGGVVIGHTQAPLVNRGDALSHVARILPEGPSPSVPESTDSQETESEPDS